LRAALAAKFLMDEYTTKTVAAREVHVSTALFGRAALVAKNAPALLDEVLNGEMPLTPAWHAVRSPRRRRRPPLSRQAPAAEPILFNACGFERSGQGVDPLMVSPVPMAGAGPMPIFLRRRTSGKDNVKGTTLDLLVRFEDHVLAGQSPYTVRTHQSALLRLAVWLQPRSFLDASPSDLSVWLDGLHLNGKGLQESVSVVHRFYEWLVREGLIRRNPATPPFHLRRPVIPADLAAWLKGWRIQRERREISPHLLAAETNLLRDFYTFLAPRSIMDATAEDMYGWLDTRGRDGQPLAVQTRKAYVSSFSAFYRWAKHAGLVAVDPTEIMIFPRRVRPVPRPITDRDLALALDRANPTIRAILSLAAFCGLRAQEIAGLTMEDIHEDLTPPVLVVASPKGYRQRTVPLHPDAWTAVKAIAPVSGALLTVQARPGQSVQWNQQHVGRAWQPHNVSKVANQYLASLGIRSSLHKLRHWYATRLYAVSMDLRLTQELLGHVDPNATIRYADYTKTKAYDVVRQLSVAAPDPTERRTFIVCSHCGRYPPLSNNSPLCRYCRTYQYRHDGALPPLTKSESARVRVAAAVELLGRNAPRDQLAEVADVHRNTVLRMINGDRRPLREAAKRAAQMGEPYATGKPGETTAQIARRMPERLRGEYLRLTEAATAPSNHR
jgi:integrase/recombinase XerC